MIKILLHGTGVLEVNITILLQDLITEERSLHPNEHCTVHKPALDFKLMMCFYFQQSPECAVCAIRFA